MVNKYESSTLLLQSKCKLRNSKVLYSIKQLRTYISLSFTFSKAGFWTVLQGKGVFQSQVGNLRSKLLKAVAVCELRAFLKGKREDTGNLDSFEESQVLVLILSWKWPQVFRRHCARALPTPRWLLRGQTTRLPLLSVSFRSGDSNHGEGLVSALCS